MPQANTKGQYMGVKENCLNQARLLPALFQTSPSPKTAGSGLHNWHFPVLQFLSQHSEQRENYSREKVFNFFKREKPNCFCILSRWILWMKFQLKPITVISYFFLVARLSMIHVAESPSASPMSISATAGRALVPARQLGLSPRCHEHLSSRYLAMILFNYCPGSKSGPSEKLRRLP